MKKAITFILSLIMVVSAASLQVFALDTTGYVEYDYSPGVANTGIMDFSYLNEMPAGQHGAVTVKDGNFVFEDGTPIRFWGVDMGFACATPAKEVAEAMAAELASSGVNFVRLHAIDCTYSGVVDYTGYTTGKATGALLKDNLDRMDYLVYCLKQKGIYIHLDTNAGRVMSTGDGFTEEEVKELQDATLRGYHVFVERIAKKELEFAKELLGHQNPYTGMRYCEDPVFAVVQLMNESSVLWLQKGNGANVLTNQLEAQFNEWLVEKYGTRENLEKAWTNLDNVCFLFKDEDPTQGSVERGKLGCWSEPGVDPVNFSMVFGPIRHADWNKFLIEIQSNVFNKFCDTLREMGYKGTFNCSNYPVGPIDLYMHSLGDVTEKNAYYNGCVDGYSVPCRFNQDIICYENPSTTTGHLASQMTQGSVADRAMVVTEWAVCSPGDFKADAVLEVASYAALQDWDGFCMFNYSFDGSQSFFNVKSYTDFFAFHMDPSAYGPFGICAAIFREGLVSVAKNSIEYVYTKDDILSNGYALGNGIGNQAVFVSRFAYRFIDDVYDGDADLVIASGNTASGDYTSAKHLLLQSIGNEYVDAMQTKKGLDEWLAKYTEEGAEQRELGNQKATIGSRYTIIKPKIAAGNTAAALQQLMTEYGLIDGTKEGFIYPGAVVSDTGELIQKNNNFKVVTDKVLVTAGEVKLSTKAGEMELTTGNDLAAVALLSRDDKEISKSSKLLLYAIGRSCASNMIWEGKKLTFLGTAPMLYEDIKGTLFVPSEAMGMKAWGLTSDGERKAEVEVTKEENGFKVTLGGYCFYELEAEERVEESNEEPSGSNSGTTLWIIIGAVAAVAIVAAVLVLTKRKK